MDLINKLFEETYSIKLTPESLVANLQLPNYTGINYVKDNEILIVVTECILEDGIKANYRYSFKENLLIMLESVINDETTVLYDREIEKRKIMKLMRQNQFHQKKLVQ